MHVPFTARLAGVVAGCLVLGAASCTTSQQFSGSGAPKLQFAGDSITVLSTPDINAHYGGTYDVAVDATFGFDTYLLAPQIAAEAALDPDVEVINLGTNDAEFIGVPRMVGTTVLEPAQTLAEVTGRLDTFASEFPSSTCVVFVTVNTHNPSWGPANAQAIDDHIRASFPHVADWDAAWHAGYFDKPDNPHPNEAGRQALLTLEDQAIASCAG